MSGLPEGWVIASLGELIQPIASKNPGLNPDDEITYFDISSIDNQSGEIIEPKQMHGAEAPSRARQVVYEGDILFSTVRPYLRAIARVPRSENGFASTGFCVIRAVPGVSEKYLFFLLRSDNFLKGLLPLQRGVSYPAVRDGDVLAQLIPLPPAAEQTRIIEKLEELLSDLDAGVAELKAAQKKLAQYRQSLLKAAVEGKLTQAWREQRSTPSPQPLSHQGRGANDAVGVKDAAANYQPRQQTDRSTATTLPSDLVEESAFRNESQSTLLPSPLVGEGSGERGRYESAHSETGAQLLERILKERRARWEAKQLAKFQAQGKTPPKDWQNKYPEPVKPDTVDLPELPKGWVWASLDMLGEIVSGVAKGTTRKSDVAVREVPYLRVANVQRGYLDLTEVKTILATEQDIAELTLQDGDVLFNEGGDRDKLGRGWVWRNQVDECIHQNHVFRMRPFSEDIQSELISHHGNTFGKVWFQNAGKQPTNLASINMTILRAFPVPVAQPTEQLEILEQLRVQLENLTDQERNVELALKQSAAQRQNILKAAFSGQLVPQNPNDEPASTLLERIRIERAAQTGDPKKTRTKAKEPA